MYCRASATDWIRSSCLIEAGAFETSGWRVMAADIGRSRYFTRSPQTDAATGHCLDASAPASAATGFAPALRRDAQPAAVPARDLGQQPVADQRQPGPAPG